VSRDARGRNGSLRERTYYSENRSFRQAFFRGKEKTGNS